MEREFALKELREATDCLKIINQIKLAEDNSIVNGLSGCNELMPIFVKSIDAAQKDKQLTKEN